MQTIHFTKGNVAINQDEEDVSLRLEAMRETFKVKLETPFGESIPSV
jgi:hypothetical protein